MKVLKYIALLGLIYVLWFCACKFYWGWELVTSAHTALLQGER